MSEDNSGESNTNYVDKKEFYRLMVERRQLVEKAKQNGDPPPPVSNEIGKIILDIATNLAYRYNFINYSFRDEMIGDGIENCLTYLDNFDSEKYDNPFAYFTQICYYAFVRRITREAKQADIKKKIIERRGLDVETYDTQDHDNGESFIEEDYQSE